MAFYVNTNTSSLFSRNRLATNSLQLDTAFQRLSSGLRINSAADDAAGLQISNRLTSQINGLYTAIRNTNDTSSLLQTAEAALAESTTILQRMRELGLQSANGSNTATDRAAINTEINALKNELDRIAQTTAFGGKKLLDGSFNSTQFQIGVNANEIISSSIGSSAAADIGRRTRAVDTSVVADIELTPGTAASPQSVSFSLGGTTTSLALDGSLTAEQLQQRINDIDGLSGVSVTGSGVAQAAVELKNFTGIADENYEYVSLQNYTPPNLADNETLVLSVGGSAYVDVSSATTLEDIKDILVASGPSGFGYTYNEELDKIFIVSEDGSSFGVNFQASPGDNAGTASTSLGIVAPYNSIGVNPTFFQGPLSGEGIDSGPSDDVSIYSLSEEVVLDLGGTQLTLDKNNADTLQQLADSLNAVGGYSATLFDDSGDGTDDSVRILRNDNADFTVDASVKYNYDDSLNSSFTIENTSADTLTLSDASQTPTAISSADVDAKYTLDFSNAFVDESVSQFSVNSTSIALSSQLSVTGIDSISVLSAADAQSSIQIIDAAIEGINAQRADLGALQNRLDSTSNNLRSVAENVTAARARILDADFAAETARLTQAQIIQQASITILAQANQRPQAALSLLG